KDVIDSRTEIRQRSTPSRDAWFTGFRATWSCPPGSMEDVIRSKNLIDNGHIARAPYLVPVTTGNRFVFFCGHDVSPSSPGDKTLQVFDAERRASAAPESRSEAEAVGRQLQAFVRWGPACLLRLQPLSYLCAKPGSLTSESSSAWGLQLIKPSGQL